MQAKLHLASAAVGADAVLYEELLGQIRALELTPTTTTARSDGVADDDDDDDDRSVDGSDIAIDDDRPLAPAINSAPTQHECVVISSDDDRSDSDGVADDDDDDDDRSVDGSDIASESSYCDEDSPTSSESSYPEEEADSAASPDTSTPRKRRRTDGW